VRAGGSEEGSLIKCTYLGIDYVVKLFNDQTLGRNEIAWTQHASDLGIGPKLYYADPSGKHMLIEFAKGTSLLPVIANAPAIIKSIGTNLALLHHSSAPFAHASDMFTRIDAKYEKLSCSGPLKNMLKDGMGYVGKIEVQLQELVIALAPCHNDLNSGNIIANNDQVILIDWGDAALGNPYYDIAAFFVLNVIDPKNEQLFFEQYDAKLLSSQWQGYMEHYKQLVHFEFALNLLLGVQTGKSELLHMPNILRANDISHYLTLLAERKVEIDSLFLYGMAVASLNKMAVNALPE
jgi:thiamine kinase-like enzyme